ncbi:hypothetical protein EJB05_50638, partial [Eragrostis curvula]
MPYDDDEEPPPPKPGPARPVPPVWLTKVHNSEAPLAANDQKVLLELHGVPSAASRAPLDLVAVIDVSGSMEGARLDNAKKALTFVVRKLTDIDRLCVVQFNHAAARLGGLRRVTEAARAELESLVGGLQADGGTNIEAGLGVGVAVLAERRFAAGRAANVMLLSDGEENNGNARRVEPGDVPVHTFGFGSGHDSRLLGDVAGKSLGGVYNFVPDSDDPAQLAKAFSRILAGLVTIVAQDLELTVTPVPGEATIKKVDAGTYPADPVGDGSSPVTVRFGTLSSEEARSVVVELALSDRTGSRPYRATVAEALYRFTTAQGQQVAAHPEPITMRRGGRKAAADAMAVPPPPPAVVTEEIRQQHAFTIKEAMAKAEEKKMEEASRILNEALKKLVEARKKLLDPILEELYKELMKLLEFFATYELYNEHGRHYAIAAKSSHDRRRSTEKGDDDAGPYDTKRVKEYRRQVEMAGERAPPSAAEDEIEEMESAVAVPADRNGERRTLALALRLLTAVLSLLAFSVMASARTTGWAGDYYGRYEPYRGVSKVLAYLLMSASSAAASRHHLWVSRFGKDSFNDKINVAVWFSFLAFLALSANALISTVNLFSRI